MQKVPTRLSIANVMVAVGFGTIMIGAGHGGGPLGYLLIYGSFDFWKFLLIPAWIGVACLAIGLFGGANRRGYALSILGSIALIVAFMVAVFMSDWPEASIETSLPFGIAVVFQSFVIVGMSRAKTHISLRDILVIVAWAASIAAIIARFWQVI